MDDFKIPIVIVLGMAVCFLMGAYAGIQYNEDHSPFQKVTYINDTTSDRDHHCYRGDTGWVYVYDEHISIIRMISVDQPLILKPDNCDRSRVE
jgi:hypothetical protein